MTFAINHSIAALALALAFTASRGLADVAPEELSVDRNGVAVAVTRYAAEGAAPRPAVLVLHGAGRIDFDPHFYASHARALARSGIDAYLVRYFTMGFTPPCPCWEAWSDTLASVTTAILRRPEASGRVGLLGFSLGGAVAVASARDPRVSALVVFYGYMPHDPTDRLPPLLALHGDADDSVPLRMGQRLVDTARRLGGRAEIVIYPGEGHRHATWKEPAASDAIRRTLVFFRAELVDR